MAVALLAACASTPVSDSGLPPETVIAQALEDPNPYAAEASLTELLARESLSDAQRAEALFQRGSLRRQAADNRRGAIDDFKKMLKLAPEHSLATRTKVELDFVEKDVQAIEESMNRFLTLSQWFDGTWVLGNHTEAAARYQKSGLAPNAEQVQKLEAAGFICKTDKDDTRLHEYGEDRDDLEGLEWCEELTG